ncbi:MAG: asparagine synthase-related protein [archaeon]
MVGLYAVWGSKDPEDSLNRLLAPSSFVGKKKIFSLSGNVGVMASCNTMESALIEKDAAILLDGDIFGIDFKKKISKPALSEILDLYRRYGMKWLPHADGEFSIIILDKARKKLIAATDYFGTRPLHYYRDKSAFCAAPQMKCIANLANPGINLKGISDYLTFNFNLSTHTFYQNVHRLASAQVLEYSGGRLLVSGYKKAHQPDKSGPDELNGLLREALEKRIDASGRFGLALSGGIDSSMLAALIRENTGRRFNTYTLGFANEGGHQTDLDYARIISEYLDTKHREIVLSSDSVTEFPKALWHNDALSGSTPQTNYFFSTIVPERSRLFIACGLDNLYSCTKTLRIMSNTYKAADMLSKLGLMKIIRSAGKHQSVSTSLRKFSFMLDNIGDPVRLRASMYPYFDASEKKAILSDESVTSLRGHDSYSSLEPFARHLPASDPLTKASSLDFETFVQCHLLEKNYKYYLHRNISVSYPLIDRQLIGALVRIPLNVRMRMTGDRKSVSRYFGVSLPGEIFSRPKQGFIFPEDRWFSEKQEEVTRIVKDLGKRDIFSNGRINHFIKKKSVNHCKKMWALFFLELWFRIFAEKQNLNEVM